MNIPDETPDRDQDSTPGEERAPDGEESPTHEASANDEVSNSGATATNASRSGEVQAVGRLLGRAIGGLTDTVGEVHRAVSERVESKAPESALPISEASNLVAQGIYQIVGQSGRVAPIAAAEIYARMNASDDVLHTSAGRAVLPAVSGIWGDSIAADHPELAIEMAVRIDGHDVNMTAPNVAEAFPRASQDLLIFIHGLTDSELTWWRSSQDTAATAPDSRDDRSDAVSEIGPVDEIESAPMLSYGDRLGEDFGYSPVYVRYNTGLRVSDNGQRLSDLLAKLVDLWPTNVRTIQLVGHSMGGLVSRSACHVGDQAREPWVLAVTSVVTIGTPHHGSPLEKSVHVADWLLSKTPETDPLAQVLRGRSAGVKDLRYGAVVEQDWRGHDPDEFLKDRGTEVPFLDHANYYFIAATITSDPEHPAGRLLGDGLVRYPSASGEATEGRVTFDMDHGTRLGGINHLSLVNHPDVYSQLKEWLSSD